MDIDSEALSSFVDALAGVYESLSKPRNASATADGGGDDAANLYTDVELSDVEKFLRDAPCHDNVPFHTAPLVRSLQQHIHQSVVQGLLQAAPPGGHGPPVVLTDEMVQLSDDLAARLKVQIGRMVWDQEAGDVTSHQNELQHEQGTLRCADVMQFSDSDDGDGFPSNLIPLCGDNFKDLDSFNDPGGFDLGEFFGGGDRNVHDGWGGGGGAHADGGGGRADLIGQLHEACSCDPDVDYQAVDYQAVDYEAVEPLLEALSTKSQLEETCLSVAAWPKLCIVLRACLHPTAAPLSVKTKVVHLLQRLLPDCVKESPQLVSDTFLTVLGPYLLHTHHTCQLEPTGGGAMDTLLLQQLESSHPTHLSLMRITLSLLGIISSDWHFLPPPVQRACTAHISSWMISSVDAALSYVLEMPPATASSAQLPPTQPAQHSSDGAERHMLTSIAGVRPTFSLAMQVLFLLDPSMRWWTRMMSTGRVALHLAPTLAPLLSLLHRRLPVLVITLSTAAPVSVAITRHMILSLSATLVLSPASRAAATIDSSAASSAATGVAVSASSAASSAASSVESVTEGMSAIAGSLINSVWSEEAPFEQCPVFVAVAAVGASSSSQPSASPSSQSSSAAQPPPSSSAAAAVAVVGASSAAQSSPSATTSAAAASAAPPPASASAASAVAAAAAAAPPLSTAAAAAGGMSEEGLQPPSVATPPWAVALLSLTCHSPQLLSPPHVHLLLTSLSVALESVCAVDAVHGVELLSSWRYNVVASVVDHLSRSPERACLFRDTVPETKPPGDESAALKGRGQLKGRQGVAPKAPDQTLSLLLSCVRMLLSLQTRAKSSAVLPSSSWIIIASTLRLLSCSMAPAHHTHMVDIVADIGQFCIMAGVCVGVATAAVAAGGAASDCGGGGGGGGDSASGSAAAAAAAGSASGGADGSSSCLAAAAAVGGGAAAAGDGGGGGGAAASQTGKVSGRSSLHSAAAATLSSMLERAPAAAALSHTKAAESACAAHITQKYALATAPERDAWMRRASVLALSTSGRQELLEAGFCDVVMDLLVTFVAEEHHLAEVLQQTPSHCPRLQPLSHMQVVLSWHRVASHLVRVGASSELSGMRPKTSMGLNVLRKLVTWLDISSADASLGTDAGAVNARPEETCHVALRCLMLWVRHRESISALDKATNARWYIGRIVELGVGQGLGVGQEPDASASVSLTRLHQHQHQQQHLHGCITINAPAAPSSSSAPAAASGVTTAGGRAVISSGATAVAADPSSSLSGGGGGGQSCVLLCQQPYLDINVCAASCLLRQIDRLNAPAGITDGQGADNKKNGGGVDGSKGGSAVHDKESEGGKRSGLSSTSMLSKLVRQEPRSGSGVDDRRSGGQCSSSGVLSKVVRQDPGMEEPLAWWRAAQEAFVSDIQHQGAAMDTSTASLMLQRIVMVAMKCGAAKFCGEPEALWVAGPVTWPLPKLYANSDPPQSQPQLPAQAQDQDLKPYLAALVELDIPVEICPDVLVPSIGVQPTHCFGSGPGEGERRGPTAGERQSTDHQHPAHIAEMGGQLAAIAWRAFGRDPRPPDMFLLWVASMMGHNAPLACEFISALATSPACPFVWPGFGEAFHKVGGGPLLLLGQCVEHVLSTSEPALHGVFTSVQLSVGHLVSHWLSSSFYGYLAPAEVQAAMTLVIAKGPDYLVYLCVAMLKARQYELLRHATDGVACQWLMEVDHSAFHVPSQVDYMIYLQLQFRTLLLPFLLR